MRYLGSWTNLNDALYLTRTQVYAPGAGVREGSHRTTVILTDGVDNIPYEGSPHTLHNATLCKNDQIRLLAVGVTDGVDEDRLMQIISSPNDYYHVEDFDALDRLVKDITPDLCYTGPPGKTSQFVSVAYSFFAALPALQR